MKEMSKISESELIIMKILWASGTYMSTQEISKQASDMIRWDRSTVRTLLSRLTDKGAVVSKKEKSLCYRAAITEAAYAQYKTRSLIDTLYQGSPKNLMASLVQSEGVSKEELKELWDFLYEEE